MFMQRVHMLATNKDLPIVALRLREGPAGPSLKGVRRGKCQGIAVQ